MNKTKTEGSSGVLVFLWDIAISGGRCSQHAWLRERKFRVFKTSHPPKSYFKQSNTVGLTAIITW